MSEEGDVPGRRQRPRDHVVSTLAKQILSGEIRPGDKLPPEADLGNQLSVSRTALRESIRTLAGKGLIVSRTRTGTIVQPSSSWNHLDPELLAWRETMEPDIAFVNALIEARQVLREIEGIEFVDFTDRDVVRHPLVQEIVLAYERRVEPREL